MHSPIYTWTYAVHNLYNVILCAVVFVDDNLENPELEEDYGYEDDQEEY